jgi:hypothetical protein
MLQHRKSFVVNALTCSPATSERFPREAMEARLHWAVMLLGAQYGSCALRRAHGSPSSMLIAFCAQKRAQEFFGLPEGTGEG